MPGAEDGSAASELAKHFEKDVFAKPRIQRLAEGFRCVKSPVGADDAWAAFDAETSGANAKEKDAGVEPSKKAAAEAALPKIVLYDCFGTAIREFTKKTDWRTIASAMEDAAKKNKKAAATAGKKSERR